MNFARKYDPAYANKGGSGGGMKINWPSGAGGASNIFSNNEMKNEDDLYN